MRVNLNYIDKHAVLEKANDRKLHVFTTNPMTMSRFRVDPQLKFMTSHETQELNHKLPRLCDCKSATHFNNYPEVLPYNVYTSSTSFSFQISLHVKDVMQSSHPLWVLEHSSLWPRESLPPRETTAMWLFKPVFY